MQPKHVHLYSLEESVGEGMLNAYYIQGVSYYWIPHILNIIKTAKNNRKKFAKTKYS